MRLCGIEPSHRGSEEFFDDLKYSSLNSIDRFLNDFGNTSKQNYIEYYQKFGRFLIALEILHAEHVFAKNMLDIEHESMTSNVFRHIWNELPGQNRPEELKSLRFITFNYDRMLEHFIYKSLRGLGHTHELALSTIAELDIVHVYGSVGEYDPKHFNNLPTLTPNDYRRRLNTDVAMSIKRAMDQLQLLTEDRVAPEIKEKIITRFANNRRVVILGFGYDHTNCKLLKDCYDKSGSSMITPDPANIRSMRNNWKGSAYEKEGQTRETIAQRLGMGIGNLGHSGDEDVHFMQNHVQLFT